MAIVVDYGDPHFGIVDATIPRDKRKHIRELLFNKYRHLISENLGPLRNDDVVGIMAVFMGGTRQELLQVIGSIKKPLNVSEIAALLNKAYSHVYEDLNILRDFGIVEFKPKGNAKLVIRTGKIIPTSKYFEQRIKHPEIDLRRNKSHYATAIRAEKKYTKELHRCLEIVRGR